MSIDLPRFTNIRSIEMIKTIIKAMYAAFISIVLISIVLAGWTSYAFISQSSKSSEIINVIKDMYDSQKSVVFDVIDLSKILIKKDISESATNESIDLLSETELLTDLEDNSQFDELSIDEDNEDNPLGIVIEPSSPDLNEKKSLEIIEEPLMNEQKEFSMKKMENDLGIGIDMN